MRAGLHGLEDAFGYYLRAARELCLELAQRPCRDGHGGAAVSAGFEELRWFALSEVHS
ncbi:hypothetical protein [Planosporangium mesophilum]|uniref:Uncharacterized protein n=1 Tax=Planosporangium mesophilum TaxID=689768 RepID=A0A8J3TEX4_9ACTN|nr:hypothetical protein [Planosporangium mesophilum]NJC85905.1 hypothetical protein [Planosporangium mesophilum]GII25044.1 hypothetical protein Pme01_46410 [Planosporangium mesophilum]